MVLTATNFCQKTELLKAYQVALFMKTPMSNEPASAGICQQRMNEKFREPEEQV